MEDEYLTGRENAVDQLNTGPVLQAYLQNSKKKI
jgi:hypothetical protein